MYAIEVRQRDVVDGKSRFTTIDMGDETFNSVYYSYYGNKEKTIKVYQCGKETFEVYFKTREVADKVVTFLKMLGYNDYDNPINTTPTACHCVSINLGMKYATLIKSDLAIKDHKINWSDPVNHIYAYRDVTSYPANQIQVYFRNYDTAKRWLEALEFIGYSTLDTRKD